MHRTHRCSRPIAGDAALRLLVSAHRGPIHGHAETGSSANVCGQWSTEPGQRCRRECAEACGSAPVVPVDTLPPSLPVPWSRCSKSSPGSSTRLAGRRSCPFSGPTGRATTASGRPVVATAANGVVDIVETGSTGLLAPPAQPVALARDVAWLLEHPEAARRMGEAGRARALALFEPAVMCGLIGQIYSRLLSLPETPPGPSRALELDLGAPSEARHLKHERLR